MCHTQVILSFRSELSPEGSCVEGLAPVQCLEVGQLGSGWILRALILSVDSFIDSIIQSWWEPEETGH